MAALSAHMRACVSDLLADAYALELRHGDQNGQHHLADATAADVATEIEQPEADVQFLDGVQGRRGWTGTRPSANRS
jgi:hypothetical protein